MNMSESVEADTLVKLFTLALISVLFSLGVIFLIASFKPGREYRLGVSATLFIIGTLLSIRLLKSRPKVVKVSVEWSPSGKTVLEEIKCPNCGATLPLPKPGQDYVKCAYCGTVVKIVEEPKW